MSGRYAASSRSLPQGQTMTPNERDRAGPAPPLDSLREQQILRTQLRARIKELWKNGSSTDAQALLQAHPSLWTDKSFVLGIAYDEYCYRREQGETPDSEEFCQR